jgi:hypothetical protein
MRPSLGPACKASHIGPPDLLFAPACWILIGPILPPDVSEDGDTSPSSLFCPSLAFKHNQNHLFSLLWPIEVFLKTYSNKSLPLLHPHHLPYFIPFSDPGRHISYTALLLLQNMARSLPPPPSTCRAEHCSLCPHSDSHLREALSMLTFPSADYHTLLLPCSQDPFATQRHLSGPSARWFCPQHPQDNAWPQVPSTHLVGGGMGGKPSQSSSLYRAPCSHYGIMTRLSILPPLVERATLGIP